MYVFHLFRNRLQNFRLKTHSDLAPIMNSTLMKKVGEKLAQTGD
jgi:hypothetical protein